MSLVGARPEVPRYIALYPEEARNRILSLKPGITDLAAIQFRAESERFADVADPEAEYISRILPLKIRCYEEYVQKRSFWLDLRLIFGTLSALAGSSPPASAPPP
jgi:lipopolysaccharide/colanic/teichoic acid biosynthesis glycosyltransferase